MENILIVEDELIVARDIRTKLEKAGYGIAGVARSVEQAQEIMAERKPSFALIDIFLKGEQTGIDLAIHLNKIGIPFIYISANSNQGVLEAAKITNPYGFIVKPFRERDLLVTLDIARYRHKSNKQLNTPSDHQSVSDAREALPSFKQFKSKNSAFSNFIGTSAQMLEVYRTIEQVAPFDTSVLLLGESGTGKEVAANCIVQLSSRSNKPYVKINCAAIPRDLMEAELFGYEKGAFTGANERKPGKFEIANGGTVLLDEIGEMPLEMQAKMLRVLQEKEVQRIGSSYPSKVDVRIIAATNKNLEKEAGEGRFRLDLYYRLHVFPIVLPPLRERKEDIPFLVNHFIKHFANQLEKSVTSIDDAALQKLKSYNWPGNVRELQHRIERAVLLAKSSTIQDI